MLSNTSHAKILTPRHINWVDIEYMTQKYKLDAVTHTFEKIIYMVCRVKICTGGNNRTLATVIATG